MDESIISEIVREMTRDELIAENNKLREKIKRLQETPCINSEELDRLHAEIDYLHGEREELLKDLRFRDGVIEGLKFATKCNGVSGGESWAN